MIYYTYKTTNLVNGKFYYGRHSAEDFPNSYLGSGHILHKAIKKYGKENFNKEVISYYDSLDLLIEGERNLITQNVVDDPECYNMRLGGYGTILVREDPEKRRNRMLGNSYKLGKSDSDEVKSKKSLAHLGKSRGVRTEDHKQNISSSRKGKGTGSSNAMADPANREKVRLSKIGKRKMYREDGTAYMGYPSETII
jgi:group I intron endonuclease